jgi:hypothetical protein
MAASIFGLMAKVWKITAYEEQMGGGPGATVRGAVERGIPEAAQFNISLEGRPLHMGPVIGDIVDVLEGLARCRSS